MRRPALLLAALLLPPLLLTNSLAMAQTPSVPPAATAAPADPVLARVDGVEIRLSELQSEAQRLPDELRAMPPAVLFPLLLDQLITQKAITAAARAQGLATDPQVRASIARAEDEALQQALITRAVAPAMTEEALRARYQAEIAGRPPEEEVHARHILVPTEAEARTALTEARAPGADFAAVARTRSTGPGAREGGDLGFFKRADMIPEFAEIAFGLQPGQISESPVRTQFGWHVIKVEARRAVPPPPFEEARDSLRQKAFEEAVKVAVDRIRGDAQIERFNMDGSRPAAPSLLDGASPPAAAPAQPRR